MEIQDILIIFIFLTMIYYFRKNYNIEPFQAPIYENKNCCVIKKKRLDDVFLYTYYKTKFCDDYHDNKLRTIKEGQLVDGKPFNMSDCKYPKKKKDIKFGSCRRLGGFECIDFVTKKDCKKVNDKMYWDPLTCNNRIKREYDFYTYSVKKLKKNRILK